MVEKGELGEVSKHRSIPDVPVSLCRHVGARECNSAVDISQTSRLLVDRRGAIDRRLLPCTHLLASVSSPIRTKCLSWAA